MSYQSQEQSVAAGRPVELYDFADEMGTHSRITSAGYPITYNSYVYLPEPCQRTELRLSDNHKKNEMQIELSRDNTFAMRYTAAPGEVPATVTIYRGHEPNFVSWWFGAIKQVKLDPNGVPTIVATPRTSSVLRVGHRRRCQRLCDHALWGEGCWLDEESYKVSGVISAISGLIVTSSTFGLQADNYYKAGKFYWGGAKRMIKAHTGNNVTLARLITGLAVGSSFQASPGCDRLPTTCDTKYGNKPNFGGEEHLPTKNPYVGDAIL